MEKKITKVKKRESNAWNKGNRIDLDMHTWAFKGIQSEIKRRFYFYYPFNIIFFPRKKKFHLFSQTKHSHQSSTLLSPTDFALVFLFSIFFHAVLDLFGVSPGCPKFLRRETSPNPNLFLSKFPCWMIFPPRIQG